MNLLSSLNAGMFGAANGWAELYVRGTNTRATWYQDFIASTSNSSGANITLDAFGAAQIYVNQLVDVLVKDADGVLVRSYTDGYSAPNIEVRSQSFTGIDYVSAVAAAGNPTTLQASLDLWKINSGAIDWKVILGGSAQTLQVALGGLTGLVYNVKNPAYGAVGDGVTNDGSAISAALAAAVAAGGGIVFFPKGTYLITAAIEWDHRVSILGVGARLSIITNNSVANARTLTWTTGTAQAEPIWIAGMSFAASQANTGEQIYATVAVNMVIDRCGFGASANATGTHVSVTGASRLKILNSRLTVNGTAATSLSLSTTCVTLIQGCTIDTGNTTYTGSFLKLTGWATVASCVIDQTVNTLGVSPIGVEVMAATDVVTVRDTRFVAVTQNFTACIKLVASAQVTTEGNDFGTTSFWYSLVASANLSAGSSLQMLAYESMGSSTVTRYCEFSEFVSSGTAPTIVLLDGYFPGHKRQVLLRNTSGGNWAAVAYTETTGSPLRTTALPATAVTAGSMMMDSFIWTDPVTPGTFVWLKWQEA